MVSVVIPTKNEAATIGKVIEGIREALRHYDHEVIVVDKSDDETIEIAAERGATVIRQEGVGYGDALKQGFEKAHGDALVMIDGDGTYEPGKIPRLVEPIQRGAADLVVGCRIKSKPEHMSLVRYIGNRAISSLFSTLYGSHITDTQSGLRAFSREAWTKMRCRERGMAIATEILVEACRKHLKIAQVHVPYYSRIGSPSKLRAWRDGLNIVSS